MSSRQIHLVDLGLASIGRVRDLMLRGSCSTILLRYWHERTLMARGFRRSAQRSRTARWEAWYPSRVMVRGIHPCVVKALLRTPRFATEHMGQRQESYLVIPNNQQIGRAHV